MEKKKKKVGTIILPDFKTYYRATVRQCSIGRGIDTDQRKRIESPVIDPPKYGQSIFDKGTKLFSGRRTVFSTNGVGTNGVGHP